MNTDRKEDRTTYPSPIYFSDTEHILPLIKVKEKKYEPYITYDRKEGNVGHAGGGYIERTVFVNTKKIKRQKIVEEFFFGKELYYTGITLLSILLPTLANVGIVVFCIILEKIFKNKLKNQRYEESNTFKKKLAKEIFKEAKSVREVIHLKSLGYKEKKIENWEIEFEFEQFCRMKWENIHNTIKVSRVTYLCILGIIGITLVASLILHK